MKILIDADACPRVVKELIYRFVGKHEIELLMVANSYIRTPPHHTIRNIVVSAGPDEADDKIVELVEAGDLVITADIPLADRVIKKNGYALNPRGELYTEENIGSRLAVRDLLDELRSAGMDSGGPSAFSSSDKQEFANSFDRFMSKHIKR
jgi:uncharacterized protein YaiI (UPF0178 family)